MARSPDRILDELLVLRCQRGDAEAFRRLVARWDRRLRCHAWYLTHDSEAAADIVQDTWLEIIRSIRRLKEPALFRGWAFRIVSNRATDRIRRRARRRTAQAELARRNGQPPEPARESADAPNRLRAAIRDLPSESQQILSMKYIDEMSVREIALVLDIPAGTVKSRLHHARERLRQILERNAP